MSDRSDCDIDLGEALEHFRARESVPPPDSRAQSLGSIPDAFRERFWSRVKRGSGLFDCWEWTGARDPRGYGHVAFRRRVFGAHRISWMLANVAIPVGLFVCHHCDNPPCVRPDHLFLGKASDNFDDMVRKKRDRYGTKTITKEQLRALCAGYSSGWVRVDVVARVLGVSPTQLAIRLAEGASSKRRR